MRAQGAGPSSLVPLVCIVVHIASHRRGAGGGAASAAAWFRDKTGMRGRAFRLPHLMEGMRFSDSGSEQSVDPRAVAGFLSSTSLTVKLNLWSICLSSAQLGCCWSGLGRAGWLGRRSDRDECSLARSAAAITPLRWYSLVERASHVTLCCGIGRRMSENVLRILILCCCCWKSGYDAEEEL